MQWFSFLKFKQWARKYRVRGELNWTERVQGDVRWGDGNLSFNDGLMGETWFAPWGEADEQYWEYYNNISGEVPRM